MNVYLKGFMVEAYLYGTSFDSCSFNELQNLYTYRQCIKSFELALS